MKEAVKYSVLPLDDRTLERLNAALVGRPDLMAGRTSLTVHQGMTGMSENAFINVKNRSHTITADVDIPKKGANGVILAQGGRFGGWSLYMKDGKPTYTYNWLGLKQYTVAATQALPPGKATIRFEFAYDGDGVGKGGTGTLFVNGKSVATGRIESTQCCAFSIDDAADVGADEGTPVTEAYAVPAKFTGKIARVTIELKEMKKADRDDAEQARLAGCEAMRRVTVDMASIRCEQYLATPPDQARDFSAWTSGYFKYKLGQAWIDLVAYEKNIVNFKDWCKYHPKETVMSGGKRATGVQ